jgi:hypothetical protein
MGSAIKDNATLTDVPEPAEEFEKAQPNGAIKLSSKRAREAIQKTNRFGMGRQFQLPIPLTAHR